jgi:hypothetical protein
LAQQVALQAQQQRQERGHEQEDAR